MLSILDAAAEYLEHIKYERKLAAVTCEQYQSSLRAVNRWCAENGYGPEPTLDAFNPEMLRRYQIARAEDGLRPRALCGLFHPLRGFARYRVKRGTIADNPTANLILPAKDVPTRLLLTDDDMQRLFDGCTRLRTQREIALARGVLSILAFGALRREELCSLRLSDLDLAEGAIVVTNGKRSKCRRVFICTAGVNALREWLSLREPDCQLDYVFMLDRRRRLHLDGISSLMAAIAATAGMRDNPACKPHSVRHWAACNLPENGAPLTTVQRHLGHTSIVTTEQYLHSSDDALRKARELTAMRSAPPHAEPQRPNLRLIGRTEDKERPRRRIAG